MRQIMLALVLLLGFAGAALAIDDAELIERLVGGSPWSGFNVQQPSGAVVNYRMIFKKQGDELTGNIEEISNLYAKFDGPVKYLTAKNGVLEFESSSGSPYTLKYSDDGKLVGIAKWRDGRGSADVKLTPAKGFSQSNTDTTPSLSGDWRFGGRLILIEQVGTKVRGSWKESWRDRDWYECSGLWFEGEVTGNRITGTRYLCRNSQWQPRQPELPLDVTIKNADTLEISILVSVARWQSRTETRTMTRIKASK